METTRAYNQIDGYENFPTIHLSDIAVFEELVNKYQPESIYIATQKQTAEGEEKDFIGRAKTVEQAVTRFAFHNDGVLYTVDALNYSSLEEYKEGLAKGFASGDDYHAASEGSFLDKEEYDSCKKAGFSDRVEYLKAQRIGFAGSVDKLQQAFVNGKLSDDHYKSAKDFQTDAQVYNFAQNFGYESYDEFENALSSGFVKSEAGDYRDAMDKGFDSYDAYASAQQGSFDDINEFNSAQDIGITDRREFDKYSELSNVKEQYGFRSMEQAHLFLLLAELGEGKKLSITRIWDMLKENQSNLGDSTASSSDKKWFDRPIAQLFGRKSSQPEWYSTTFKDVVELKVFLISNENIGKVGVYDADGEVFERRSVPVDEVNTAAPALEKAEEEKSE